MAVTNQLDPATLAVIGSATNLVAPINTSFARYRVVFRQPANATGAVLFDDLKLTTATDVVTARDSLEWYDQKQIAVARGDAVAVRETKRIRTGPLGRNVMIGSGAMR